MAMFPHEIKMIEHHRKIAIVYPDGTEKLAFFHKWTHFESYGDCALIEMTDGTLKYAVWEHVRFLPMDNEIPAEELEKTLYKFGLLKGGESNDSM